MTDTAPLGNDLSLDRGRLNVVLFSQAGCVYCAEVREHYLKPLRAEHRPTINVAEVGLDVRAKLRDWRGTVSTEADFARDSGVRFAPTVMFFDGRGKTVADPIVGLSRDFFGGYLEQRIATALRAVQRSQAS